MKETFLVAMDGLYRLCIWISGISLLIMTIVIPIGIFNRYVLGHGSMWPEPLAILCMIIFTFIGAAASYRAGGHIAVTMLTDRLPEKVRPILTQVVNLLMIALAIFVARYGISLCLVTWDQYIAEFPVLRVGLTYIPLPLGSIITLLFILESMVFGPQDRRPIVLIGSPGAGNHDPDHDQPKKR
ncbi:MAG: C4-dicarboxylate ABC transporter [Desulfobulbaceae bacterium BRH_c16a]|nr:MAG: C4-dicarboxylate ABC transporter [Desulfobulbaceae bacterium BRH_c16a]